MLTAISVGLLTHPVLVDPDSSQKYTFFSLSLQVWAWSCGATLSLSLSLADLVLRPHGPVLKHGVGETWAACFLYSFFDT